MSIEAINEQLLRAIGVGVALVDLDSLMVQFRNDTFDEWFGSADGQVKLDTLFPDLDLTDLVTQLDAGAPVSKEVSFKLRRRTMSVAMEFNRANDASERIAVLVCQNITRIKELESMIDSYSMMVERNTHEIQREKERVERLLLNMMPRAAYEEYKTFGVVAPKLFEPVSVLALDFIGFDDLTHSQDPGIIVSELNDIYSAFDRIGAQFSCQRIRTNGDSYIAVSGVPDPNADHAAALAKSGVRFLRYLARRNETHPIQWIARVGLETGSVIGSVVGTQNYIYDVFGPTVTKALSHRAAAAPMSISTSSHFVELIDDEFAAQPMDSGDRVLLAEKADTANFG